jgi:hypothetical protein
VNPSRVAAAALLLIALAVACSSRDDDPPSKRWTGLAPPGYDVDDRFRLDVEAASQSTPVGNRTTREALHSSGFKAGESQVFTNGPDFAVVSEYRFATLDGATSFVDFEVSALRGLGSVAVFGTRDVPGGTTYVLHAPTRARGREVFCEGVVFGVSTSAYLVTRCGTYPSSADTAEALASKVRELAT